MIPEALMRAIPKLALLILVLAGPPVLAAPAPPARLVKVLPHYLDRAGRHSVSPSLYDRDAYQAYLKRTPDARGGLRFDVQWKTTMNVPLTVRVELRGAREGKPTTATMEASLQRKGWSSRWTSLALRDEAYHQLGEMVSWRVSLWDGPKLLAEQKSFLW